MEPLNKIDKSLDERFDPKIRTIGESQFQNYNNDKVSTPLSEYFRIEYSKLITEEIRKYLHAQISNILDFSLRYGLTILPGIHTVSYTHLTLPTNREV